MIDRSSHPAAPRLAPIALATLAVLPATTAGCGEERESPARSASTQAPAPQTSSTRLQVIAPPSRGGPFRFRPRRLEARAGRIAVRFINRESYAHNVRIQTGETCCYEPGYRELGGTDTIRAGSTSATVELKPGRYIFMCSIGDHWSQGMSGVLKVS
jgi:plastocyanin